MRIIFAGSGEFGVPTLRRLHELGHEIAAVYTQPDRPAGRGRAMHETAIASLASSRNLPLTKTPDINREVQPAADLLVVIAFGQKIAEHIVHQPRLGSVNLHASRLPKYRGAAPINWAILRGESITGNSVIRLAPKMDAGPILAQSELPIDPLETAGEVHDRLALDGVALMARVLDNLATGRAVETAQDDAQATAAPKLTRQMAHIDWSRNASDIANQIRALYPWPGCHVRLMERDREISRATLVRTRARTDAKPQAAVGDVDDLGHVACGRGAIEIVELQPEGKRRMSLADFRNGHPWHAGIRLISAV